MPVGILLIVYAVFVIGVISWFNWAIANIPSSAFPVWFSLLVASYLFALAALWLAQGSIILPLIGLLLARSCFSIAAGISSLYPQES